MAKEFDATPLVGSWCIYRSQTAVRKNLGRAGLGSPRWNKVVMAALRVALSLSLGGLKLAMSE
eukprot:3620297-Amphidinium_carterae.2